MNSSKHGNPFATPTQTLLLQAAVLPGQSAWQAWQKWKAQIDFEQELDTGSYRLLPLVYHNLRAFAADIDDPVLRKCKGIYRKEWYKNQMLFHVIAKVLNLFQTAGIETLILKGAALSILYYKDYGLRPMGDFDVMIPTAKRDAAIDVLTQGKMWWPILQVTPERLKTGSIPDTRHAWGFENIDRRQFDLHWNALIECRSSNADDDFWNGSISVQVGDVTTRALNPTDQLLHVCVHGLAWNLTPSLRWIADAMMILNADHAEIDWPRLSAQAQKRRLTLPLRNALAYLHDSFGADIPTDILIDLSKVQVSTVERELYAAITTKPAWLRGLPYLWYRHVFDLEAAGKTNWLQKLIQFPRYVQGYKGIDRRGLLAWAISRPFVRLNKTVRGVD